MNNFGNDITFSFVVPVRNEADKLDGFFRSLIAEAQKLGGASEIVFINDGSDDDTDAVLHRLQIDNNLVRVLDLSRQFGRAAAVAAGVSVACGQAVVTFDRRCDNWPQLIARLVSSWQEGAEIVHAVAKTPDDQSKGRGTRSIILRSLGRGRTDTFSSADMRLIDQKAVAAIRAAPSHATVDSLVAELGFRQTDITHDGVVRADDIAPAKPSYEPSRPFCVLMAGGGVLLTMAALFTAIFLVAAFFGAGPSGWVWLAMVGAAFAGVQLLGISLVGLYVAQNVSGTVPHPLYIVRSQAGFEDQQGETPTEQTGRSGYVVYT